MRSTRDDSEWHKAAIKEKIDGTCSSCGGYGRVPLVGRSETICPRCYGAGKVEKKGSI